MGVAQPFIVKKKMWENKKNCGRVRLRNFLLHIYLTAENLVGT